MKDAARQAVSINPKFMSLIMCNGDTNETTHNTQTSSVTFDGAEVAKSIPLSLQRIMKNGENGNVRARVEIHERYTHGGKC